MTGRKISDMSDAAGTLWLDVAKRDWSDALLDKCGLSRSHMPTLVEGCEVSATLDPQVAKLWGLNASVVVAGGGGDNAVSAIGVGGGLAGGCLYLSRDLRRAVRGHRRLSSGAAVGGSRLPATCCRTVASDERDA
ncbi:Xylulose kinase [Raoultella terrigena]|uniref:Xylulose kinase n=1 Tax=Raoultella terrigena TaxID=577 RepID=A0A3P8JR99_RAOTE|nr:Xylulose kinase [Raoultella terrigena]